LAFGRKTGVMEMGGLVLERFEGGVCDVVGVLYL
jgi:hypothetical protein